MRVERAAAAAVIATTLAAALAGCSAGPSGTATATSGGGGAATSSPESSTSGGAAGPVSAGSGTAAVDCGAFASVVAGLFPDGASSPVESEGTCTWGIGTNAKAQPADLANSLQDVFALHFTYGDDAETQYGGNVQFDGGADHAVPIDGVGSAAVYVPSDDGVPKVAAWFGKVSCGATLMIADARTVRLTPGTSGRIIADADVAGLAKRIADACASGWKG